jgi:hypothetical protein
MLMISQFPMFGNIHGDAYSSILIRFKDLKPAYTLSEMSDNVHIAFAFRYPDTILQIPDNKLNLDIRDTAVLLKISNGLVMFSCNSVDRGYEDAPWSFRYLTQTVVDLNANAVIDLGNWENSLSVDNKRKAVNVQAMHFDTAITFLIPWSELFSHVVATMLPKLNFTCSLISNDTKIMILVDSVQSQSLLCDYCPGACVRPNRFVVVKKDQSRGVIANTLYFPLYFQSEGRNQHPNPWIPRYHPWIKRFPHMSMTGAEQIPPVHLMHTLNTRRFSETDKRSIVYIPRTHRGTRHLANQMKMLTTLCEIIPERSKYQLDVFIPTNEYLKDRTHLGLMNAIAVIAPHGGALANMLFIPQDAVLIELNDVNQGFWFYFHLSKLLGLRYIPCIVQGYDHHKASLNMSVNMTLITTLLQTAVPNLGDLYLSREHAPINSDEGKTHRQKCLQKIKSVKDY